MHKPFRLWTLLCVGVILLGRALTTSALLGDAPGDPVLALARHDAIITEDVLDKIRIEAGLDLGFWPSLRALSRPLRGGSFGQSSVTGHDVWPDLASSISYRPPLALLGLTSGIAISVPITPLATRHPGGWLDQLAVTLASAVATILACWLGWLLLLHFAVQLGWLPAMGARPPHRVTVADAEPGRRNLSHAYSALMSSTSDRRLPFFPSWSSSPRADNSRTDRTQDTRSVLCSRWRVGEVAKGYAAVLVTLWTALDRTGTDPAPRLGVFFYVASAALTALALIMVGQLNRTEHPAAIAFYFVLISMLPALVTIPRGWVLPRGWTFILLINSGLFGGFGHVCVTLWSWYGAASRLAPFEHVAPL